MSDKNIENNEEEVVEKSAKQLEKEAKKAAKLAKLQEKQAKQAVQQQSAPKEKVEVSLINFLNIHMFCSTKSIFFHTFTYILFCLYTCRKK